MKNIFIEDSMSSFEDFHDKEWIEDLFESISGSGCEGIVEEFIAHLWGSARSFILPWLLVDSVYSVVKENNPSITISKESLWTQYLKINAFKGALWKTAENSYCSIYYAYENFVVNLLSHISNKKTRVTDGNFNSILATHFGESIVGKTWASPSLVAAREVRNAIVHNGGKVTKKLEKLQNIPKVEAGDILISASDTRALYMHLKPLIKILIQSTLKNNGR